MINRRTLLRTAPAALAAPVFLRRAAAAEASSLTIAFPTDVTSWDAMNSGTSVTQSLYKCVFDTLLDIAPDARLVPGLASFEWTDNNNQVLELTLRDGLTFHNGDPLTSDDVHFTFFTRLKADDSLANAGNFGNIVDAVETPTRNKAIFKFNAKYIVAPQRIASVGYVMPRRYYESVGREEYLKKPVGSGPYHLTDYQRDSRIALRAFEGHWRGAPAIERATIQIIKDPTTRIAAIQSGQVDFAHNLPVRDVVRLAALPGLVGGLNPVSNAIMIHMVNKGVFQDQNLRLAMHHAINKEALSRAFFNGKAEPLSMWGGTGSVANDPTFKFPYDINLAKSLLAKSGYGPSNPARIEFTTFSGVFPNDFDIARTIVQMWKQAGIEANLSVMEFTKYGELARNDKLEAPVLYSWFNPTDDPESYSGAIMDPKKRYSVWKSADVSLRLDPLLEETDYDKRTAGYREFDKWCVLQGYACPILQGVSAVVYSNRIGYVPYRTGMIAPYAWSLKS